MENILSIFVKSIFIENMVFAFFFGMCSFIAVSKSVKTAMGLGVAVIYVMTMTVPINYLLNEYILKPGALAWVNPDYGVMGSTPVDLSFLSFIVFIAVIASFVQLVEMVVEKFAPALLQERDDANLGEATTFALGSGIGWWLAIILMAAIRERLAYSNIPAPLRGAGITFILTGLMGIAFMTFLGIQL